MPRKSAKSLASDLASEAAKLDLTAFTLNIPIHILLAESIHVARFVQHYWRTQIDPESGFLRRPGLDLLHHNLLPESIAAEILALRDLVQAAHLAHVLAVTPPEHTTARADLVVDELCTALQWICDETTLGEPHAKLATITLRHLDDPDDDAALANELADYLGLARELQHELTQLGAFDPKLVDEAERLVLTLRARPAVRRRTTQANAFLQQRNRYAALLIQKLNRACAAARYVFRHHDEILDEVTSAYERRRRTAVAPTFELANVA
jgi:hypothetical protein